MIESSTRQLRKIQIPLMFDKSAPIIAALIEEINHNCVIIICLFNRYYFVQYRTYENLKFIFSLIMIYLTLGNFQIDTLINRMNRFDKYKNWIWIFSNFFKRGDIHG